jgi:uncharacterized protein (TIRG00374 family)
VIPERRKLVKRFLPFLLIGILVIVAYLYFAQVNMQEMIAHFQNVNPIYFSLAVAALLLDTLFFALSWHYLLDSLSIRVPFKKTFLFVWAATFVDILVPAESVSGDISKAYLMSRETGETEQNTGKIAASLVSHRILGTLVVLGSLLISCLFFILSSQIPQELVLGMSVFNWILVVTVGTAVSLIFLFTLALKEEITRKLTDSLLRVIVFISRGRWRLTGLRAQVRTALNAFHYAIRVLSGRPSSLARPVVFSLMSWLFSLLISSMVFVSLLGHPIHFGVVVVVHSLSCAIQSIPFGIPAEVGVTEVAMFSLYTSFLEGIPGMAGFDVLSISVAATFLIRILTVGIRMFIGFAAIQWIGAKTLMLSSSQK